MHDKHWLYTSHYMLETVIYCLISRGLKDFVVKLTLDILPVLVIKKVSRIRQLVLEDISNCYFFLMSNGIYFRSCLLNWLNEKWQFIKDMLYARGLGISQCITLHI